LPVLRGSRPPGLFTRPVVLNRLQLIGVLLALPMSKKTFISYSKDASVKAHQICGYLEPLGVETFLFEKSMAENEPNRAETIFCEMEQSVAVILVLSARSRESAWVSSELGIAIGMGDKKIFVYKTAHNLNVPDHISRKRVTVLSRLEDLDDFFSE
jgi:hypothetical protein